MGLRGHLVIACSLLFFCSNAAAEPYIPTDDEEVLETLTLTVDQLNSQTPTPTPEAIPEPAAGTQDTHLDSRSPQ